MSRSARDLPNGPPVTIGVGAGVVPLTAPPARSDGRLACCVSSCNPLSRVVDCTCPRPGTDPEGERAIRHALPASVPRPAARHPMRTLVSRLLRSKTTRPTTPHRPAARLQLEYLEDRTTPAVFTVTNTNDGGV